MTGDWTTKNRQATAFYLAHTLAVADAMIAFEVACRGNGAPRLIDHYDLIPFMPENTRASRDPFCCYVTISGDLSEPVSIGIRPDRLFSLVYPGNLRHNFALELDRATAPIRSTVLLARSSFRRKLIGYLHAWEAHEHTATWGFQSFRVLTITTSEVRLENMLAALRDVTDGGAPGLFLFATAERFASEGPFDGWVNGEGQPTSLLPRAVS